MRKNREQHRRTVALSKIQSIKTMLSHFRCIDAQVAHLEARENLAQCEDALLAGSENIGTLLTSDFFTPSALQVGKAVIDRLSDLHLQSIDHARGMAEWEIEEQTTWHRNLHLEKYTKNLGKRITRKIAEKRDDIGAAEAITLRNLLQRDDAR